MDAIVIFAKISQSCGTHENVKVSNNIRGLTSSKNRFDISATCFFESNEKSLVEFDIRQVTCRRCWLKCVGVSLDFVDFSQFLPVFSKTWDPSDAIKTTRMKVLFGYL